MASSFASIGVLYIWFDAIRLICHRCALSFFTYSKFKKKDLQPIFSIFIDKFRFLEMSFACYF